MFFLREEICRQQPVGLAGPVRFLQMQQGQIRGSELLAILCWTSITKPHI